MLLHNERYEEIKECVVATFKKYDIKTIPIDCFDLAKKLNIIMTPFSKLTAEQLNKIKFCEGEVIMFGINDKIYMFYNDMDFYETRQRFSMFHEIGHIVLGHRCESELAKSEADFFARYAIAPIPIVDKLNCNNIVDLCKIFNISIDCAVNVLRNYENWIRLRQGNLKSYEKDLLELFDSQE